MKPGVRIMAVAAVLCAAAATRGQVTRVATFENYTEGQSFKPSFTDPLSGINFHSSTAASHDFVIEYADSEFGGGNYLTANGYVDGPGGGWSNGFGFVGQLPSPAQFVSLDVSFAFSHHGLGVTLRAYTADGTLVGEDAGTYDSTSPFNLRVDASGYSIATFSVASGTGTAYDNIRFTALPEPSVSSLATAALAFAGHRRRRRMESTEQ